MKKIFLTLFITLFTILTLQGQPVLHIDPLQYDYGTVNEGDKVKKEITLSNRGDRELSVSITTSCNCLVVGDDSFTLKPGAKKNVLLSFNTKGYSGKVTREFIIQSNDPEKSLIYYQMKGTINTGPESTVSISKEVIKTNAFELERTNNKSVVYFFAYTSCQSCIPLLKKLVQWKREQNNTISIHFYNLEDPVNKENLYTISDKLNNYSLKLPLLLYDSQFYGGKKEISSFLNNNLSKSNSSGTTPFKALSVPAIFFYGLADGVNPCAFTLIILLISYLTLQLKRKESILAAGLLYIGSVYITYFLIGLGLFEFLRRMQGFGIVAVILKYGLSALLLGLALFSLYDFFKARQGKTDEMTLKLPGFIQRIIRRNIRNQTKSTHIFAGSIILGVTVSVFELGCTGQVYLPILGYIIRSNPSNITGIALLSLYNLAFIIPLASVFILVYNGLSSEKIASFFAERLPLVKLLFFTLFILLAILNIIL